MCKSFAFCAVALKTSDSFATRVDVSNSADVFAAIDLSFSNEKTLELESVNVIVNVQALDASSFDTRIDFTIAVVSAGTVYTVVSFVVFKSTL